MRRALMLWLVVTAGPSCIADQDVASALNDYCAGSQGKQSCNQSDMPTGCCPNLVCTGTCVPLTAGQCLGDGVVGHGTQITHSPCGCDADCAATFQQCLNGTCEKP